MLVRGNQQATTGWFVGILEGEGSFHKPKFGGVEVRVHNTNLDIIEGCESYLKKNNIFFTRQVQDRAGRKLQYTISIRNSKTIYRFVDRLYTLISPSMECRLDEFQRIIGASETTCDPSIIDYDWLTGIYEAEGSFSLCLNNRGVAALKIEISNTNQRIIRKVQSHLATMQCGYHLVDKVHKVGCSQAQMVEIYGMRRCQRFLESMRGRWVAERNVRRTEGMMRFIMSRLARPRKAPYSAEELSSIQSVRDLNA